MEIVECDRLDGHAGQESAWLEGDEGFAVGARALREHEDGRPRVRSGALLDGLDGFFLGSRVLAVDKAAAAKAKGSG